MVIFLTTEAALFSILLFTYFFLRAGAKAWPPDGIADPELVKSGIRSAILIASSLPMHWADRAVRRGKIGRMQVSLALSFTMGAVFIVGHFQEWTELGFGPTKNAYSSVFFTITGFHALHLIGGLCIQAFVWLRSFFGHFDAEHHLAVRNTAIYWHFVDGVWVFVFSALYLSVRVHL